MKFEKINNKGQARLFKNQHLEHLTKTHPLVIWGMYLPVIAVMLYYSYVVKQLNGIQVLLAFLGGVFCWSFFEYMMHRFVFHFFARFKKATKIVYVIHGNHHEYPRDKERLFMPPVPSLMVAVLVFLMLYLLCSLFSAAFYVFALFPGFVTGYLMYGSMHYAIHAYKPPFKWMKPLWRNHHLHHYKNTEMGFGVSSTLWDHVFGTMFDLKVEADDKEKTEQLMFE